MCDCKNTHILRNPVNRSALIKELMEQKQALEVAVCIRYDGTIFIVSNKPLVFGKLNLRRDNLMIA